MTQNSHNFGCGVSEKFIYIAKGGETFHSLPGLELMHACLRFWQTSALCRFFFSFWTKYLCGAEFSTMIAGKTKDRDIGEGEEINTCSFAFVFITIL